MTSTQKLVAYFSKMHRKPSVTVLMKLCYLTDLTAIKGSDNQITDLKYRRYTFGPFDEKIYIELEELVSKHILATKTEYTPYGNELITYDYDKPEEFDLDLPETEKKYADEVLEALGAYGAKALTEVAYKTKPMIKIGATLGGTEHLNEELDLKAA
jgi:uncharacterized phage-associated protein